MGMEHKVSLGILTKNRRAVNSKGKRLLIKKKKKTDKKEHVPFSIS